MPLQDLEYGEKTKKKKKKKGKKEKKKKKKKKWKMRNIHRRAGNMSRNTQKREK